MNIKTGEEQYLGLKLMSAECSEKAVKCNKKMKERPYRRVSNASKNFAIQ